MGRAEFSYANLLHAQFDLLLNLVHFGRLFFTVTIFAAW